jgi:hypothetical protein
MSKRPSQRPTELVSVRFTKDAMDAVRQTAEDEHRSVSNFCMAVVVDYLEGKLTYRQ